VKLGDILEYEQPTKYIVQSTNYKSKYKIPVLTAGKTFILGNTNETHGVYSANKLPVIIFDDFTAAIKLVSFPFKVKSSAMKILRVKDKTQADICYIYSVMLPIKFSTVIHKRYWISEYANIKIPLPPIEIQQEYVAEHKEEQFIISANRRLIELMTSKIQNTLAEAWGEYYT
jgi:type I restriction enzyme S subunit